MSAETATMSEAFAACLCLQAPANPGAKSQYTSWDPQQGLQESHTLVSQPVVQVFKHSRKPQTTQVMSHYQKRKRRYISTTPPFKVSAPFLSPEHPPWAPPQRQPCSFPLQSSTGTPRATRPQTGNIPYFLNQPKTFSSFLRMEKIPPMSEAAHKMDQGRH